MSAELLYHPYFEPELGWLRKMLLFYDRIYVIDPRQGTGSRTKHMDDFLKANPDTLIAISPEDAERAMVESDIPLLGKVLDKILRGQSGPGKRIEFIISNNGEISVEGYGFFHREKFTPNIVKLLQGKGCLSEEAGKIANAVSGREDYLVEVRAGNLFLAALAKRIAVRRGMITISDLPNDYAYASLSQEHGAKWLSDPRVDLAKVIISGKIPEKAETMSHEDFRKIRDRYKGLRELFRVYLNESFVEMNVTDGVDPDVLHRKVIEASIRFGRDFGLETDSIISRYPKIRDWSYLGLVSAGAFLGATLSAMGDRSGSLVSAVGSAGFGISRLAFGNGEQKTRHSKMFQSFGSLNREIESKDCDDLWLS